MPPVQKAKTAVEHVTDERDHEHEGDAGVHKTASKASTVGDAQSHVTQASHSTAGKSSISHSTDDNQSSNNSNVGGHNSNVCNHNNGVARSVSRVVGPTLPDRQNVRGSTAILSAHTGADGTSRTLNLNLNGKRRKKPILDIIYDGVCARACY